MGYSEITVWNLYADICTKLKPSQVTDNNDNFDYLQELLTRGYDAILVSYGNTYLGNKSVEQQKMRLLECIYPYAKKVYELIDKKKAYERLRNIHVLFAGQRFSGEWKFRKYIFPAEIIGKR